METADDRALDYARQLAYLREAAMALLLHDTPTNRANLWRLVHPHDWAAECQEFGCTDTDHSSRQSDA